LLRGSVCYSDDASLALRKCPVALCPVAQGMPSCSGEKKKNNKKGDILANF